MTETDYTRYRGKCKEMAEAACAADPTLTLRRGWYDCPIWGRQAHWWCTRPDGRIVDPSALQFPSGGLADYIPYDGFIECEHCGKRVHEDDAYVDPPHVFCSYECYGRAVM